MKITEYLSTFFSTNSSTKNKLHDLIKKSDFSGLKTYIDTLQISILSFDDPSLLLLAIEVYLDPKSVIDDKELQKEIILFLSKCGLKFYFPGGTFILKIYDYWNPEIHTEQEFNEDLHDLFDNVIKDGHLELLKNTIPKAHFKTCQHNHDQCPLHKTDPCPMPDPTNQPNHPINPFSHSFQKVQIILTENWASIKIQSLWRGYSTRKRLQNNHQPNTSYAVI